MGHGASRTGGPNVLPRQVIIQIRNIPALIILELSPPEPTSVITAQQTQMNVHIRSHTLKLIKHRVHQKRYHISFQYDALVDSNIILYYYGIEIMDKHQHTQYIYVDPDNSEPTQTYQLQAQLKGLFKTDNTIDFSHHDEKIRQSDQDTYAIIIQIIDATNESHQETTFANIKFTSNNAQIEAVKQKVHINGSTYNINPIFGEQYSTTSRIIEKQDQCVIFMSQNPITAALSCRHLCLCDTCTEDLRERGYARCPLCREYISKFLKIHQLIGLGEQWPLQF